MKVTRVPLEKPSSTTNGTRTMNIETYDYAKRRHCELIAMLQTDKQTVLVLEIATKREAARQKDTKNRICHSRKNHLGQKILAPLLSSFSNKKSTPMPKPMSVIVKIKISENKWRHWNLCLFNRACSICQVTS